MTNGYQWYTNRSLGLCCLTTPHITTTNQFTLMPYMLTSNTATNTMMSHVETIEMSAESVIFYVAMT